MIQVVRNKIFLEQSTDRPTFIMIAVLTIEQYEKVDINRKYPSSLGVRKTVLHKFDGLNNRI